MNKNIVIFDLDGTLADIEHRLHHIRPVKCLHVAGEQIEPKADWKAFFAACDQDKPILEIIEVLFALHTVGCAIWVVSGRAADTRDKTLAWLHQYALTPDKLLMRQPDDHQPDDELKEGWIKDKTIPLDDVLCVFEDRQRVVDMWRRYGLRVLQVAAGNY